jgi:glycine oxidase
MITRSADVVIVGGGVMGSAIALRLAEAGVGALVLERAVPGAEASSVAAGILGPAIEAHRPGVMLRLGLASRERHAELARELLDDHGVDVGFRRSGVLRIALDEAEERAVREHAAMLEAEGIPHRLLGPAEVLALEPACAPDVRLGLDLPDEAQVDPRALLPALALAAERAGALFRTGATVRGLVREGSRVQGVEVDGERIFAETVIVAAGSWTTLVPGLDLPADAVHPVRGQIVATRSRPPLMRRVVFGAGGYILTRPDGRMLCGSTEERVGFERAVTFEGLAHILETAARVVPALARAPVEGHWSSFRPGTPDERPLIGRASLEGLVLASGHFRNGILLSAITADLVRDLILGRPLDADTLAALDPRRFTVGSGKPS